MNYAATNSYLLRSKRVKLIFFISIFFFYSFLFGQSKNQNCDSIIEQENLEFEIKTITGSSESLLPGKTRSLTCKEIKLILSSRKEDENTTIQLDRYTQVVILKKNK
jgi:hypothetical protein